VEAVSSLEEAGEGNLLAIVPEYSLARGVRIARWNSCLQRLIRSVNRRERPLVFLLYQDLPLTETVSSLRGRYRGLGEGVTSDESRLWADP
jgi:hypothetical protein